MDNHSKHFHERQAELLTKFRAIQKTLLEGYERAADEARIDTQDENPLVAQWASMRYAWNMKEADELRERMGHEQ